MTEVALKRFNMMTGWHMRKKDMGTQEGGWLAGDKEGESVSGQGLCRVSSRNSAKI